MEWLKEKEKQNALNEVRILASIHHPHVISYKEAFIDEATSCLCLITEYADNGDLFQKVQEHQQSNTYCHEGEIWKIFIQLVFGLKKLHDLKVFHRDLKSANVFLFRDGTVKLGDMNVSKVAKQGMLFTQTGTPFYASPEVWRDQPYDWKSDIWSLGCVLYEAIALRPPFKGTDMENLYNNVLSGKYSPIPNIFSIDISNVIKSMLQVNPKLRPTCLTILNMESVKKRIEKYFGKDYLLDERQTFQGLRKKTTPDEDPQKPQDILLSTIRLTDNLFFLKDRLPTPQYNGNRSSKVNRQKTNDDIELQQGSQSPIKTETEKKIESIMPLSYISPSQRKQDEPKLIKNASQLKLVSIDNFDVEPSSQEKSQSLKAPSVKQVSSKRIPSIKRSKKGLGQPQVSMSQPSLQVKQPQHDFTEEVKRQLKNENLLTQKSKQPHLKNLTLKGSSSQVVLPQINTAKSPLSPDLQTQSSIQQFLSQSTKKPKKQLLISINNKNDTVPLSYLKQSVNTSPKDQMVKSNRYNIHMDNQIQLPELRGLSLESYKNIDGSKNLTLIPPILRQNDESKYLGRQSLQNEVIKNALKAYKPSERIRILPKKQLDFNEDRQMYNQ